MSDSTVGRKANERLAKKGMAHRMLRKTESYKRTVFCACTRGGVFFKFYLAGDYLPVRTCSARIEQKEPPL
jgi:hypothetical protein